jgi:hypothetical protein
MKTAKKIKQLDGWRGGASLYELSESVKFTQVYGGPKQETNYVIVSAVYAMYSGPETYIFPANEKGEPLNMRELPGSFSGGEDHKRALNNAGFEVI